MHGIGSRIRMALGIALAPVWPAGAAVYLVSPDGDDRASGRYNSPWASLARVNRTVQPGDRVYFLPGVYTGSITPRLGGRDDASIGYYSTVPGAAVIAPEPGRYAVAFEKRGWIEVNGFRLEGIPTGGWLRLRDVEHCSFRNLWMVNRGRPTPVQTTGLRGCTFGNLLLTGESAPALATPPAAGADDYWLLNSVTECLFQRIHFDRAGPGALRFDGKSAENLVSGCLFTGGGDRMLLVAAAGGRLLVEQCVFEQGALPAAEVWALPQLTMRWNLIRDLQLSAFPGGAGAYLAHNTFFSVPPPVGAENFPTWRNNLFAVSAKGFRQLSAGNFQLVRNSEFVDAGTPLTRVTRSGVGVDLPVADAAFFRGGFRHELVGDFIWIGESRRPAQVLEVNRQTGELHLDREVNYEIGMPVFFPFHGEAPDAGAYELGLGPTGPLLPLSVGPDTRQYLMQQLFFPRFERHFRGRSDFGGEPGDRKERRRRWRERQVWRDRAEINRWQSQAPAEESRL